MLISTGNELDFHFWVRHGSTHAELEIQSISKSFERCLIASIDKRIYSDTVTSYLKHENRYFGFTCVYFECKNKFYTTLINGNVTWM